MMEFGWKETELNHYLISPYFLGHWTRESIFHLFSLLDCKQSRKIHSPELNHLSLLFIPAFWLALNSKRSLLLPYLLPYSEPDFTLSESSSVTSPCLDLFFFHSVKQQRRRIRFPSPVSKSERRINDRSLSVKTIDSWEFTEQVGFLACLVGSFSLMRVDSFTYFWGHFCR